MTSSFSFKEIAESQVLRGVDTGLVRRLFKRGRLESPLMLLSRSEISRNYRALAEALPRAEIHYAVKSNNHPVFLDELHRAGSRFEVCSGREIEVVVRAGAEPSALVHSHPVKSLREFDTAVSAGVRTFVVDNIDEVRKLRRFRTTRLRILIRFRVVNAVKAVVDLQYKYGCTVDEVLPLAEETRKAGHDVYGLCFHIGSQCIHAENYVNAINAAGDLIKALERAGFDIRLLDIGGGFPVAYVEPVPPIDQFCRPINKALETQIRPDIKVICEPGRFISASPVTLVCCVIGKAVRDGKIWYYLDDGLYSTFSGIVYDHCQYPVITNRSGEGRLSVLAGPTCDSFDVMYDGLLIPEHNIGDMIVFPLTGAYCAVSGSDFNSLKRPEYAIID
ncbi:MAG: type III PLP-dependent enzyme [Candidatus Zixiibacteriota bacterium]